MFTQSCFIRKNSDKLRTGLDHIRKRNLSQKRMPILVSTFDCFYSVRNSAEGIENMILNGFTDCGTNEGLFLAIAALRDDTDKDQWFTDGANWEQCDRNDWIDNISSLCVGGRYNYDKDGELSESFHKATVEELIDHFK